MDHEEIGVQSYGANQFIVKSLDRASTQHRLRCRQIDQIIGVNDERTKTQFLSSGAKSRSIRLRNA